MRNFVIFAVCALLLTGCASKRRVQTVPAVHPNEIHILAETQRFAAALGISARAVITTTQYMVPASNPEYPGEKVPAAGWYGDGLIKYWRPVVQERDQAYGTALAAHETCHIKFHSEEAAGDCARVLMGGE